MCEDVKGQKSVGPGAGCWGRTVRDTRVPSVKAFSVRGSLWWWHTAMVRLPSLPSVTVEVRGGSRRGFEDAAEHVLGEGRHSSWISKGFLHSNFDPGQVDWVVGRLTTE